LMKEYVDLLNALHRRGKLARLSQLEGG
jgi:hypothetical protein